MAYDDSSPFFFIFPISRKIHAADGFSRRVFGRIRLGSFSERKKIAQPDNALLFSFNGRFSADSMVDSSIWKRFHKEET